MLQSFCWPVLVLIVEASITCGPRRRAPKQSKRASTAPKSESCQFFCAGPVGERRLVCDRARPYFRPCCRAPRGALSSMFASPCLSMAP